MIDEKEIQNIQKSANIVDIVSSYLPLTLKGKNYFGVCPFHEDHSPSMSVSLEKQMYKCFSCGAAGNVFKFVSDYENISFLEAVKVVADKCGITFQGTIKSKSSVKNHKQEYEITDLALKFYQNNLNTELGLKAKDYLKKRFLNEDIIKDFNIGLALNKDYSLFQVFKNNNYSIEKLIELGLVNQNKDYFNDVFNNRIIFPIHNLDGDVIGFTGRIYEVSDQAKYINSKETIIFKKGQILFNYHRAKNEIQRKKEVIIVEGNMDAIRLYANGVKNVLALMGTSLTKEQTDIIKKLRAKVILLLDNDNAGEEATFQNGNILEKAGINPLIVRLSGEKDPDEYIIKNGIDAIIENLSNPISFLDFKLMYLKKNKDLTKTNDLVNYVKIVIENIKDIEDELIKDVMLRKISEQYNISLDILKKELTKIENSKINKPLIEKKLAKKRFSKYDIAAQNIIYFMMNDGKYIEKFKKELGYIDNKDYRSLVNEIIYYYDNYQKIDIAAFTTFISCKDYLTEEITQILKNVNLEELTMEAFMEFINVANQELRKNEIKKLKEQIIKESDVNKKLKLANKILELKKGCVGNE